MATPKPAHVRLFTADLQSQEEWPQWYYHDLHGELQGPFDAATMSRWCGDNALPLDLKCVGIYPHDSGVLPTNIAQFQPLQKLLDNAEAGIRYSPLRLIKGTLSEEGPATPQSAAPGKGGRTGPNGAQGVPQQPVAGPADVTRAIDQRAVAVMPALTAQQLHMQGQGLLQQLQHQTQNRQQQAQQRVSAAAVGRQPLQIPLQQQQQPNRSAGTVRRGNNSQPSPSQSLHEQHMQHMMQQAAATAASADSASADAGGLPSIAPGSSEWSDTLTKLLTRDGFVGKDADVKWRVILSSGDRVGPFTPDQMVEWLLNGVLPKGINKQQANQHSANPAALQLAGILSADYNAQRLPGAKFFKPLGQLIPAIAAGMAYTAVNKHDLQRGIPQPGWNEGPGKGPAAVAPAAAGAGKGPAGQQGGKGAKGRNAAAAAVAGGMNSRGPSAGRNNQQGAISRPRSAAGAAAAAAAAGLGVSNSIETPAPTKPAFQHPMALRQQQRQQQQQQQEELTAAAAAATEAVLGGYKGQQGMQHPRGPGGASPHAAAAAAGAQGMKGLPGNRHNAAVNSASRGILMAANSMGGAAAAQQHQLNQAAVAQAAAFAAAAGRLGQGGFAQLQQQQLQMQMQGLSVGTPTAAYAQGMQQAMWLKQQQQQLPGQALLANYHMHAANAGAAAAGAAGEGNPAAAPMLQGQLIPNGALPRTSSTGSSALQQQHQQQLGQEGSNAAAAAATMKAGRGYPPFQQQQDWQQQQYAMAGQQGRPDGVPGAAAPHSNAILMQAALVLFLQEQQQQQQLSGGAAADVLQTKWWVQRGERAFGGPFSGAQMYQTYLQPGPGVVRFTDSTLISAILAPANSRDVPPAKTFVPLGALLEAAIQGYCLVPVTKESAMQQQPVQVRHLATGMVVPLQQVVSSPLLQRSHSQSPHTGQEPRHSLDDSSSSDAQQQKSADGLLHGGVSPGPSHGPTSSRGGSHAVPPSPQKARAAAVVQQQPQFISAPGGGYVAIAPGGSVPAGAAAAAMLPAAAAGGMGHMGHVPAMGGLVAGPGGLPMVPPAAAAAAAAADPLSMAAALFSSNSTYLWFVMHPSADPQSAPRTTGPHESSEMLTMFKDGRLQLSSMVSGVHRALVGQQQPQQQRFEPLQLVLVSHFAQQQQMNAAAAAAAGGPMGQMVPAAFVPGGQMGPMLVPVSGGGAGGQIMAVPAGMQLQMQQMQQLQQMQMMPQMQAMAPFLQQGGMLLPQAMMAPGAGAMPAAAQQQQAAGDAGAAAASPAPGSSSSNAVLPAQNGDGNRSGAVPTRVDTWGSLAAAQELTAQKRVSAGSGSSSHPQQQQIHQQMSLGAQAVEAALAASSRRTSTESYHSQASHAAALLWQQQQQQHGQFPGPRSGGGFGQAPHHPQQQQQAAAHLMVRRTSSGSSRGNATGGPASINGLDAAAAVAAALGHSAGLVGPGGFGLQMQYPQQVGGMGAIPEHQQQQQPQQQVEEMEVLQVEQGTAADSKGPTAAAAAAAVQDVSGGNSSSNGSPAVSDAAMGEPVAA